MGEKIEFNLRTNKLFVVAKCVGVRKGDYYEHYAAPEVAVPVPGSDTLVESPEVMLVLSGAFDLVIPELEAPLQLVAGETSSAVRFRAAQRIVATRDDSSYVCIRPRDRRCWQRSAGFVAAGDTIAVETPPCEQAYLYVATGGLIDEAGEHGVGDLIRLELGEQDFIAAHDTRFIQVWR